MNHNPVYTLFSQTTVSGMSTNTALRNLQPDTEYTVTVVPVYADLEGKRQSENGKTSKWPIGVSDARRSTLTPLGVSPCH